MGYLHLYCGDGKGKTTAAIGLAVRMAGAGKKAVIVRFLKNDGSGEVAALGGIPGITVIPCGRSFGFTWQMTEKERSEAAVWYRELFERACREARRLAAQAAPCQETSAPVSGDCDVLLVLDELCAALGAGLLSPEAVFTFLDGRPGNLEVVVTGRNPAPELLLRADYATEFKKLRHPYDQGVAARRGIEY